MSEIKIGDTVDCSGCVWHAPATCVEGKVVYGPDSDGHYTVDGKWSDGCSWHYASPAIPEEVRKHLVLALDSQLRLTNQEKSMASMEHLVSKRIADDKAARDWLAKCPQATEPLQINEANNAWKAFSPPREPKEGT